MILVKEQKKKQPNREDMLSSAPVRISIALRDTCAKMHIKITITST